jgi:hypothetical protein
MRFGSCLRRKWIDRISIRSLVLYQSRDPMPPYMVQALINFCYIGFLSTGFLCEIQYAPAEDLFGVLPTFLLREYSYLHKPVSGVETDIASSRGAL